MWLNLTRRDPTALSSNPVIYFCEDHFNLPNDMGKYIQYHVMGSVPQVANSLFDAKNPPSINKSILGKWPEVQTLEMLLQAYDEEDPENAKKALNSPFIKHMDVEYAILARDMPLPEGISAPIKASVRENAAPSYVSPNSQTVVTIEGTPREKSSGEPEPEPSTQGAEGSEDEYEGGLC